MMNWGGGGLEYHCSAVLYQIFRASHLQMNTTWGQKQTFEYKSHIFTAIAKFQLCEINSKTTNTCIKIAALIKFMSYWLLYSDWATSPVETWASCFGLFHLCPGQIGWTALCQMGGPATVQALHGLIFAWPISSLPPSLLLAPTPRLRELEWKAGQREAAQTSWCCVSPPGWMHRGRRGVGVQAWAGWQ